MKRTFTILCLFSFMASFAQTNESHMGGFYSIPVGKFASTDITDGGYAEPGLGIVFDSWRTIENWGNFGYMSHSTYQWNKLNTNQLAKDYTEELGLKVTSTESRYSPFVTTLGPCYKLPITDKFELSGALGAGMLFNNTKGLTLDIFDDSGDLLGSYQLNFDNNLAFAYYGTVQANYTIMEDLLKLGLYVDYTGASQKVDIRVAGENTSDKQEINYISFGFKLILVSQNR